MKPEDLERYRRLAQEARAKQQAVQAAQPAPAAAGGPAVRTKQDPALEHFGRMADPDSTIGTIYAGSFERLSDVPTTQPIVEMPKAEDLPMLESLGYSELADLVRTRSQADTPEPPVSLKPSVSLEPPKLPKPPKPLVSLEPPVSAPAVHPSFDLEQKKGTPFTADGPVKAKKVVERALELPGGRQEIPPGVAQQALEFGLVKKIHNAKYGRSKDWASLPEEERKKIREAAASLAKRKVAQVEGRSEQRGNVLVDLDPAKTIKSISEGNTWLGWLIGSAPTHKLLKATMGKEVADKSTRWIAPFLALSTPGGRSVEVQDERPVMGMQKESKLSWFFRLAPSTVIGAYFQPGVETWGDEAHLRKIYAEGYDVTQDLPRIGEAYAKLTPWVDSDLAKTVAGFTGVAAIVLLEPDASSLALLTLGKGVRTVKRLAGPARLLTDTVFEPTLKAWDEALESGKSLKEIEATLPADKHGPTQQLWRLFQAQLISRIMAEGGRIDSTVTTFARRYPELLQEASEGVLRGEANLQAALAKNTEAQSRLTKAKRAVVRAESAEVEAKELQQQLLDLEKLSGAVDDAFRQFEAIAEVRGKRVDALARSMNISQQAARVESRVAAMAAHRKLIEEFNENKRLLEVLRKQRLKPTMQAAMRGVSPDPVRELRAPRGGLVKPHGPVVQQIATRTAELPTAPVLRGPERAVSVLSQRFMRLLQRQREIVNEVRQIRAQGILDMPEDLTLSAWGRWAAASEAYERAVTAITKRLGAEKRGARELLGKLNERTRSIRAAITLGARDVGSAQRAKVAAARSVDLAMAQADEAARRVGTRQATLDEKKRILQSLQDLPDTARDVISVLRRSVRATSRLLRDGKPLDDIGEFSYKDSISATAAGREAIEVLQEMQIRYGEEAVQWALQVEPSMARTLASAKKITDAEQLHALGRLEAAAWRASELAGDEAAAGKMLLRTIEQVPRSFGPMTYESMLASGLRNAAAFRRTVDPILSRIGGVAPKAVREVYRRAVERLSANRLEMNAVIRESSRGLGAAWEYILTNTPMKAHDMVSVGNRGAMPHADKALEYLRAVALGDGWNSDLVVQAISRAALAPAGEGPQLAAATLATRLAEALPDMRNGAELVAWIQRNVEQVTMGVTGRADRWRTTQRFVIEALLQASNQYDALFDMLRATGPGLDANVAKAMDFITGVGVDPAPLRSVSVNQVVSAMNRYALPRTQQLQKPAQVLSDFLRSYGDGVSQANKLMKVAEIEGMGVYMPEHIRQALNGIPRRLAKQLEEFDTPGNPFLGYARNLLQTWRIATVNGWVLPRAAHFANTFFGDWSQLIPAVGFRAATRIALGNAPAYVPFVGRQLQDALSTAARSNSLLRAMFHPDLAAVMRGADDVVVVTGDGPTTARRFLREAHEDGMYDSLSSQDLLDATARSYKTLGQKVWEVASGQDVPGHIKKAASMLESVQHRQRVLLYLEARTGRLTGAPMARQAAKELVLGNLYDWKLGTAAIEGATIAKIAAYWGYRRNMVRQLGAILTEGFTAPGHEYLLRALTGRTKLARVRQTGQLLSAIPEAIYWQDPEETLDDAEQYELMGLRDAPWWANSASFLTNRLLTKRRKLWYSEVQGRDVDFESILLPSLTTMDAIWLMTLFSQTGVASAVMLGEQVGLKPRVTTVGAEEMWRRNAEGIAGMMMPGWEQVIGNLLGARSQESVYGTTVPAAQAQLLYQMGWEPFMRTYRDPDGKLRYEVDAGIMGIVGQLVSLSPQFTDIARTWSHVANPSMRDGLIQGVAEAALRFSGLVKFAPHNPRVSREWEVIGQNRDLQEQMREVNRLTEVR